MYLVVRMLRSGIEAEQEGRGCGWACYFDRLVRKAFSDNVTGELCGYGVEVAKQRTQNQIRGRLEWGMGRSGEYCRLPEKGLLIFFFFFFFKR